MLKVLTKIFGSRNERLLKQYARTVARINALESEIAGLSDGALRGSIAEQVHAPAAAQHGRYNRSRVPQGAT